METSADSSGGGWFCYMLRSVDGKKTYVGATVNPDRRLRQHNGEICGGARATKGRVWRRVFLIGGFAEERAALRFEWRWKWLTRAHGIGDTWMERRMFALAELIQEKEEAGEPVTVLEEAVA
jgi:predicted GIY-YIG superfamily endonuclease